MPGATAPGIFAGLLVKKRPRTLTLAVGQSGPVGLCKTTCRPRRRSAWRLVVLPGFRQIRLRTECGCAFSLHKLRPGVLAKSQEVLSHTTQVVCSVTHP